MSEAKKQSHQNAPIPREELLHPDPPGFAMTLFFLFIKN
jgi:hypothetical protein